MSAQIHHCMICDLPERTTVEQWRVKEGLSQRAIRQRMIDELGITVSVGTVANHFKYIDAEIDRTIESEVRAGTAAHAKDAMQVFPDNITTTTALLDNLVVEGNVKRPQFIPYAVALLKERRESAQGLLRLTPGDPEGKAAAALNTWADVVRAALKGNKDDDAAAGE